MPRDMTAIFRTDWDKRRGGGDRARGVGHVGIENATGLEVLKDAHLLLEPSRTRTALSSKMEHNVLNSLRSLETKFAAGIITPALIISIATHEALSQIPAVSSENYMEERSNTACTQNAINVIRGKFLR